MMAKRKLVKRTEKRGQVVRALTEEDLTDASGGDGSKTVTTNE
jgi:hypothetical protein